MRTEIMSSLPVETIESTPVATSRKSDVSKYRCTAGREDAVVGAAVDAAEAIADVSTGHPRGMAKADAVESKRLTRSGQLRRGSRMAMLPALRRFCASRSKPPGLRCDPAPKRTFGEALASAPRRPERAAT